MALNRKEYQQRRTGGSQGSQGTARLQPIIDGDQLKARGLWLDQWYSELPHRHIYKQFQWKPNRTVGIFNLQNQNAAVNVSNVLILKRQRSKRLHRRKCKPWSMWNNWRARRSVCRNTWSRAVGSWRSICNTHSCKICRPCSYNILLPLLASSVWGVIVLGRLR